MGAVMKAKKKARKKVAVKKAPLIMTEQGARDAIAWLRKVAAAHLERAIDGAMVHIREQMNAGLVKWADKAGDVVRVRTEPEVKEVLRTLLRRVISMVEQSGGYCSVCGHFYVSARPDGNGFITFDIGAWYGCGFVMTQKSLKPEYREAIRKLPAEPVAPDDVPAGVAGAARPCVAESAPGGNGEPG